MTTRLKFWTGPAAVKELAEKFRQAKFTVVIEGTEHVYIDAPGSTPEGARWDTLVDLERTHGTDFGLK